MRNPVAIGGLGGSARGMEAASGSAYLGSNPSPAARAARAGSPLSDTLLADAGTGPPRRRRGDPPLRVPLPVPGPRPRDGSALRPREHRHRDPRVAPGRDGVARDDAPHRRTLAPVMPARTSAPDSAPGSRPRDGA